MNKQDYLFKAFENRAYTKKAFLLSIFSVINEEENNKLKKAPYSLLKEGNKAYFLDENNEQIFIDDYVPNVALFDKKEPLTVKNETPRWNMDIGEYQTTVGRFLFNCCVLFEALGRRVPYQEGAMNGGIIKGFISDLMVDNEDISGKPIPEGKASVDECLKVTKQLDYLEGLNHVFVKASSYDLFTIDPAIIKLRDELLAKLEAEGKLNDEIAVASVIDQLVEMDKKIQLSGPSQDLFIKSSYITDSRKKMFLLFDMVPDWHTGKYELLRNSLQEGWDFSKINSYANTAVSASYDRGVGTARGGTEFKIALALTNNIKGVFGDCGTTRGESVLINKFNKSGWIGGFYIDKGKTVEITKENIESLIGKTVSMRVPHYCKIPDGNICETCLGSRLGGLKDRVSSEVGLIMQTYQNLSMKSMHTSSLHTVTCEIDDIIR